MLRRTLLGWLSVVPLAPLAAKAVTAPIAPLRWTQADIDGLVRRWDALPHTLTAAEQRAVWLQGRAQRAPTT